MVKVEKRGNVQPLDSSAHIDEPAQVGERVASQIAVEHFEGF